jgi:multidrug efflux system membrane fusion protein
MIMSAASPSRTVDIRPRVAGEVTGIHFRDGEIVPKGQLLFTIDPRPFAPRSGRSARQPGQRRERACLGTHRLGARQPLAGAEASRRVKSTRCAERSRRSRPRSPPRRRAFVRIARLFFTQVRAQIGGRISDRVDPSNQVADRGWRMAGGEGTGGTVLTMINALGPSTSPSTALRRCTSRRRLRSHIQLQNEADHRWKGRLDFMVSTTTPCRPIRRARS